MLDYVQGVIHSSADVSIILDIGVLGLHIMVPDVSLFSPGQKIRLITHMHWSAEQGPTLYGFMHSFEKIVFLNIIGCAGIGPKIALAVLKTLGAKQFVYAVVQERTDLLSKVPGVGMKKAEQLVVHLRSKASKLMLTEDLGDTHSAGIMIDVTQALSSLNYTQSEIAAALRNITHNTQESTASFDQLMRQALSFLAKKV